MTNNEIIEKLRWTKFVVPCEILNVHTKFSNKLNRDYVVDYEVMVALNGEKYTIPMDKTCIVTLAIGNRINIMNYRLDASDALRPRKYGEGTCLKRINAVRNTLTSIYNRETESNIGENRGLKYEKFKIIHNTNTLSGESIYTIDGVFKDSGEKMFTLLFQELTIKDRYAITLLLKGESIKEWYIEANYKSNGYIEVDNREIYSFMKQLDDTLLQFRK